MDFVAALPPDLTENIFSYLPMEDLEYCNKVSQLWNTFISDSHRGRRIIQKNNWERGTFKKHYLEHESAIEYESLNLKVYPFKKSLDLYYYPFLMRKKGTQDNFGFYMIYIDANFEMSSELLFTSSKNNHLFIPCACVMGDYVVWFYDNEVQCFDAKCELNNRVKTIGTMKESNNFSEMDPDRNEYPRFLAMDSHHIVAATYVCLKVWCKQTHELILERSVPPKPKAEHVCSFLDGCLVISTTPSIGHPSRIEVHKIRNNANITLQHELVIDGKVIDLKCDETSIAYTYEDPAGHIVVLDRKTYTVKFSHPLYQYFSLHGISNELIILQHVFKFYALNFITCEFYKSKPTSSQIYTVFDNLAVACYENEDHTDSTVDIWDWKRNVKLCSLTGENPSGKLKIVSVSELMVVAIEEETGNFIIYKFE